MIKQVKDTKTFLEICDKLDDVPDCKLSKKSLYSYMISGEYNKRIFVYASFKDKMTGCEIIALNKDLNNVLTLSVIFLWISPRYSKLWKEYMKFTELKTLEFKCKKINFTTSRNKKSIDRKLGKYGYQKKYIVIEKEIKEVS